MVGQNDISDATTIVIESEPPRMFVESDILMMESGGVTSVVTQEMLVGTSYVFTLGVFESEIWERELEINPQGINESDEDLLRRHDQLVELADEPLEIFRRAYLRLTQDIEWWRLDRSEVVGCMDEETILLVERIQALRNEY